jgi:NitT/TauT family transport system substrate-binding protein
MIVAHLGHLRRIVAAGAAAALAIAGIAGCGSASSSTPGGGAALTHLTVGALAITDDAPLFIAIKKGYFKQQGLSVTPKIVPASTDAIPDMISGSVDIIGSGNYVSFFEAAAKGVIKIDVLAAGSQCRGNTLNVLAMPSSKITSPADLAGKSIAVNLTGNIQTLTINAVLKAKGVNPAGIKYVEIPFQDMTTALTAGRVDAISEVEPFITAAEHAGAKSVLAECQGSTAGIPLGGYYALQSWVQKNPKTAAAFRRAIDEAQVTANSDRKLVEQVLPTYTKITPAIAAQISLPYYPPTLDAAQLDRIVALMRSGGLLTGPFNLTPMLFQPSS